MGDFKRTKKEIIVLGSGIVGLTCALVLCETGFNVRILADMLPTDIPDTSYTSPWAGAHFRPFPSRTESDREEAALTRLTLRYFEALARNEPESSVRFVEGIEYFEQPDEPYLMLNGGYSEGIDSFQKLHKDQVPAGVKFGTKYRTWVLNAPYYLKYLQSKLTMVYDVKFEKKKFLSLKRVFEMDPDVILINATGRGLQYYGGYDNECYTIRGQTLLVRPPKDCPYLEKTITHQSKEGFWTFLIPRPFYGGVILGGTKQPNDSCRAARNEDTLAISSRAKTLFPGLFRNGVLDIISINVGFRPARNGGLRIEMEKVNGNMVIHAYGAGGMGYELSYGIGIKVKEILYSVDSLCSKL